MSQNGNEKAKDKYEANVPMAYKRPKPSDPPYVVYSLILFRFLFVSS